MKPILISLALGGLGAFSSSADVLSFKFQDGQDTEFGSGISAGAPDYAFINWNFLQTDWSGNAENDVVMSALKNSAGEVTTSLLGITYGVHTDPVHYDAANTWRSSIGNATPNDTLMNGYLDDGGDNQPYVNFSLTEDALPNYTVVVYVHGDGVNGSVGRYWIEEWTDPLTEGTPITDRVAITANEYNGTFIQAGGDFSQTVIPMDVDVATGNFIVFKGLTVRNFRVRAAGNGDPEDAGRGPLNAIQILDTVGDPTGDNDGDNLLNGWEVNFGLDPESAIGDDGAGGNPDGDGLTNLQEQAAGTSPLDADTDRDGFDDEVETNTGTFVDVSNTGTDPLDNDSDDDGLLDGAEDNSGVFVDADQAGSNPNVVDSDADGLPDGWEGLNTLDPNDNGSTEARNGPDGDPDSDNSLNSEEFVRGTLPQDDDTDDDGVIDGSEDGGGVFVSPTQTGTDPLNPDSDFDSLLDGVETGDGNFVDADATGSDPNLHDSDGDGYFDEQEVAQSTDPNDPTSKPGFPNPQGFWSFDDQGETETADDSGNGNTGTVFGTPTYVAGHSGLPGDFAIDFDGIDDEVNTTLNLNNTPSFTLAGWVRAPMAQTGTSGLFGQNDIIEFGVNVPGNLHLWTNPGGAINHPMVTSEEWQHIAVTGDTSGRTIYVNGELAAEGVAGSPIGTSAFSVNIGGGTIFNEAGNFFLGQINDVGVWNTALSGALIKGLADGTISPLPGLGGGGDLRISSFEIGETNVEVVVSGTRSGLSYIIEASTSLLENDWTEVVDFEGAADASETTLLLPLSEVNDPERFFRASLLDDQ